MAIQKGISTTQDYTRVRPDIRSDIQFIDNEGNLIQIPYDELIKFRVPQNKAIVISRQPDNAHSEDIATCDSGIMGCPG